MDRINPHGIRHWEQNWRHQNNDGDNLQKAAKNQNNQEGDQEEEEYIIHILYKEISH